MNIGMRTSLSKFTAKDYVQNGLIAMWDGIENVGWGKHDANATAWKDLVGSNNLVLGTNGSWGKDYLKSNGYGAAYLSNILNDIQGYEILISIESGAESAIFYNGVNEITIWYLNGSIGWKRSTNSIIFPLNEFGLFSAFSNGMYKNGKIEQSSNVYDYFGSFDSIGISFRGSFPFYGKIKTLRVYNRALTPLEVKRNYNIDKYRFCLK